MREGRRDLLWRFRTDQAMSFQSPWLGLSLLLATVAGGLIGPGSRVKRGFTYPGTLWCGAGNNAESYEQLGEYEETDRCCRDHDQCQHVIHPFTLGYGYHNFRWHTVSHCDCDTRLKECLRQVNDTASRVVGQAFFNVIQVPCFELTYEEQCVERYWFGWCKSYAPMPQAVLHDPVLYEFGGALIDVLPHTSPALGTTTQTWRIQHPPAHPAGKGAKKGKKKEKRKRKKGPWLRQLPGPGKELEESKMSAARGSGAATLDRGGKDGFNDILHDEPEAQELTTSEAEAETTAQAKKARKKGRQRKKGHRKKAVPSPGPSLG